VKSPFGDEITILWKINGAITRLFRIRPANTIRKKTLLFGPEEIHPISEPGVE
jgi:hypothetical protein